MKPGFPAIALILAIGLVAGCQSRPSNTPKPLVQAHAHNDYEHDRPLVDALEEGFCSVEADIFLVDGQLLVAHNRDKVQPERTLQALYLEPLRERVHQNGGRVYRAGPEFVLLIDLKSPWQEIYPVLREVLRQYSDVLTTVEGGRPRTKAITAILTGNRSRSMFAGETTRYAAFDGDLESLESEEPPNLIPWVSLNWASLFHSSGAGPLSPGEETTLKELVAKAHRTGRKLRFWGAPDKPEFWQLLRSHGVDLINTDDLTGLGRFLNTPQSRKLN